MMASRSIIRGSATNGPIHWAASLAPSAPHPGPAGRSVSCGTGIHQGHRDIPIRAEALPDGRSARRPVVSPFRIVGRSPEFIEAGHDAAGERRRPAFGSAGTSARSGPSRQFPGMELLPARAWSKLARLRDQHCLVMSLGKSHQRFQGAMEPVFARRPCDEFDIE